VRAATKQDAINQADAALGPCRRGWYWGFRVKRIEAAVIADSEAVR
jgi:glycosyltransferase A (GT-A) superfamily protein (DUF2064 family)